MYHLSLLPKIGTYMVAGIGFRHLDDYHSTVRTWDLRTYNEVTKISEEENVHAVRICYDKYLIAAMNDYSEDKYKICEWDLFTGNKIWDKKGSSIISGLEISSDDQLIVTAEGTKANFRDAKTGNLIDVVTCKKEITAYQICERVSGMW